MRVTRKEFLRAAGVVLIAGGKARAAAATRWAMVIDIPKCLAKPGCTKCMDACGAAHNIPRFRDPRREVKWIWKEKFESAMGEGEYTREALKDKLVPVMCNHCEQPSCVRVCPTKATWKRDDGIVMMDSHRCIGCRYCMAACPYGSRSFNWSDPRPAIAKLNADYPTRTKGVVEKCTFCEERLAKNQLPLCVEACPQKALTFGNLNDPNSAVRRKLREQFSIRRKPELGTKPGIFYIV